MGKGCLQVSNTLVANVILKKELKNEQISENLITDHVSSFSFLDLEIDKLGY